jgi:hypothetical protein
MQVPYLFVYNKDITDEAGPVLAGVELMYDWENIQPDYVDADGSVGVNYKYYTENLDYAFQTLQFYADAAQPADDQPAGAAEPSAFTDVSGGHWAYAAIASAVEKGYLKGATATTFDPGGAASRGQFITVLGRLEGVGDASASASVATAYSDVAAGQYYASHVKWGSDNGVVNGISEGVFGWNLSVTREQAAAFIARYLKLKGVELSAEGAEGFTDQAGISAWALNDVLALQKANILSGRTDGSFDGKGNITRAELATLLNNTISKGLGE